jgi:twinkle protein
MTADEQLADKLAGEGIVPKDLHCGDQKLICPKCSAQRRNKTEPCLSLTITDDGAVWKCHNCEWSGGARTGKRSEYQPQSKREPVRIMHKPAALPAHAIAYFADRGISEEALDYAGVGWSDQRQSVVFPFRKPGDAAIVNAKFRKLPKDGFSQIKDGEKLYWLVDKLDVAKSRDLFIVEGEIDALSLIEAGIPNVLSVPDGAPKTVGDGNQHAKKFSFLPACMEWTEPFDRIIIATDMDEPGHALAEELARRYGKEQCWRVEWPADTKDANDYLIQFGKVSLGEWCRKARPWPIEGLFTVGDYAQEVMRLFYEGRARGISTGLPSLDHLYTVAAGQLSIVTGVPNHGKSEFLDQLMINLARLQQWAFGICSFENDPPNQISKLVEKWTQLPFWDGPTMRMTSWNLEKAMADISEHFHFLRAEGEEAPTLAWILAKARILVMRFGIRGLVIDPYNEIEHRRPDNMTETEYVSHMLSQLKRFATAHGVHVWFVAHPAKLKVEHGKTPVPTLYDISGSANFVNKADCGVVVHRGQEAGTTDVYIRKIRFKWVGQQGKVTLGYDKVTGVYSDLGQFQIA